MIFKFTVTLYLIDTMMVLLEKESVDLLKYETESVHRVTCYICGRI